MFLGGREGVNCIFNDNIRESNIDQDRGYILKSDTHMSSTLRWGWSDKAKMRCYWTH